MRSVGLVLQLLLALSTVAFPSETLDVYFINVGHGDAILVDCGSWEALVDSGGPTSRWCSDLAKTSGDCGGYCIGCHMALLSSTIDDGLDLAILTHNHEDHYGGFLFILDAFEVQEFWHSETLEPDHTAESFELFAQQIQAMPFCPLAHARGDQFGIGRMVWTILHPDEPLRSSSNHNKNSLVLLLQYGSVAFLFTGDIQTPSETIIQTISLPEGCLVLKVAHHGSDSSTSLDFLEWADPELAVVSADSDDLCHQVVMNLTQKGIPFFETYSSGTIKVSTDGETVWVTTEALAGLDYICEDN